MNNEKSLSVPQFAIASVAVISGAWYVKQIVGAKLAYRRYKKLRRNMAV